LQTQQQWQHAPASASLWSIPPAPIEADVVVIVVMVVTKENAMSGACNTYEGKKKSMKTYN
jgi:hypothetical protein